MSEDKIVDVPEVNSYYIDLTSQHNDVYKCVRIDDPDGNPFPYIMYRCGTLYDFSIYNWKKC
jgi:hypothetical protein